MQLSAPTVTNTLMVLDMFGSSKTFRIAILIWVWNRPDIIIFSAFVICNTSYKFVALWETLSFFFKMLFGIECVLATSLPSKLSAVVIWMVGFVLNPPMIQSWWIIGLDSTKKDIRTNFENHSVPWELSEPVLPRRLIRFLAELKNLLILFEDFLLSAFLKLSEYEPCSELWTSISDAENKMNNFENKILRLRWKGQFTILKNTYYLIRLRNWLA